VDLAQAVVPGASMEEIGMRPGEKLHEEMISEDDSRRTIQTKSRFIVTPVVAEWGFTRPSGTPMTEGKAYRSDTNDLWMTEADIKDFIASLA
jgi:UDP-N-acetylglucosamine 4,6-dehydratase